MAIVALLLALLIGDDAVRTFLFGVIAYVSLVETAKLLNEG